MNKGLLESTCSKCGYVMDAATCLEDKDAIATPGSLSI